ncbi:hypothetical protein OIU78_008138, partial [Salix suchowensis]
MEKVLTSAKGRDFVKPSKFTEEMDADR